MAPEQINGDTVDARTDLYAVGCVAYCLLTGRLVFEDKTVLAMMAHHMQTKPAPPSQRTELPVPQALDDAVLACLEKHPGQRPASARELHTLLARCEPAEPWTPERAREWWDRHEPG
jgi:serine/threonine-protein kinase